MAVAVKTASSQQQTLGYEPAAPVPAVGDSVCGLGVEYFEFVNLMDELRELHEWQLFTS